MKIVVDQPLDTLTLGRIGIDHLRESPERDTMLDRYSKLREHLTSCRRYDRHAYDLERSPLGDQLEISSRRISQLASIVFGK